MKGVIKMKLKNTLCYILSLLMIVSAFAPSITVTAAESDDEFQLSRDYLTEEYVNEEHKLSTMTKYFEDDKYEVWGLAETGEVGIKVKATGQILLTNPYNASTSQSSEAVKANLLSQIILTYSDSSGTKVNFNSYSDAAVNGQIKMNKTRTGLRTEYTLGKEQAKYLVPRQIEKNSFEQNIIEPFEDKTSREFKMLSAYYTLQDISDPTLTESMRSSMKVKWPITEKYAIYVLDPGVSNRELELLASYIENNTNYSYEKMAEDYELIEYVDTSAAPALFRFAIEYSLDENGIQIRMPASSIKYDSSNYRLESVKFLPYFGAGCNDNTGFTFVPDGSGTITRFEDIKDRAFTLSGKLYGRDYSFHTISGYTQETMRIPAFGIIENQPQVEWIPEPEVDENAENAENADASAETAAADENKDSEQTAENTDETANETDAADGTENAETPAEENAADENTSDEQTAELPVLTKGFVAYLEEGDAMADISADHGGSVHKFSSVYSTFYPKPSDTYALTGISSTGSATYTIYSDRRYTGNYTLRIFPICKEGADYTDMAAEIRNYLTNTGVLTPINPDEEPTDDVPLYIENFGTIKTQQKIAGFPVNLQSPLTTFEQTKNMVEELKSEGVGNIDVRLTGWYNGGLQKTAPSKLKVVGALGGKKGLKELIAYAKENNVGIYPDIEFTYVGYFSAFDGFKYKRDSVKTIDNRSAAHRIYNALYQGFEEDGNLIISPNAMERFYNKIEKKYSELDGDTISVASLGYDLNSDHNEDLLLNREDSKEVIQDFLETLDNNTGKIMIDGGNAYALKYADHILNVPLDSSQNINTSMSVPFMGMVLHGSTEFAGTAINLDGDYEYSVLKAIENGANLYYIVSKDNTSELKTFPEFSKYYAIRYDNWKQDMIDTYNTFNAAMKKVKYSFISEHEYLGTRLVRVAYDNGTEFILNYNTHDVELDDGTTVEAMSFIVR